MLKPVEHIQQIFAFEPADELTRAQAEKTINDLYPEITWSVLIKPGNSHASARLIIIPEWQSQQQETFYSVKWS